MSPQLNAPTMPRSSTARSFSSAEADMIGGQLSISINTENALSRAAPTGCWRWASRMSP